ncbi:hypothetical protein IAR55_003896 [Kwoniella newhampshirensis]|uniref:GATA-type domain-containing protein n=1 Tax=Kwoniella newhampshirensis TaxID=1651941 RepID=A0AAW0YYE9_9TREE
MSVDIDVNIQESLNSVIDPELRDPSVPRSPDTPQSPSVPPVDTSAPILKPDTHSPHLTKSGRPSKVRPIVPGSTADFRRREANRLAAERSRSRQHDKSSALDNAAKVLSEENARLREQIAQLEGGLRGSGVGFTGQEDTVEHQEVVAEVGTGHSTGGQREETPIQTQEQQEAHSHTILAALTDITGVDFSEGNEASWMQGMENFLKDSDVSGRLGELAAVATGHDEGGSTDSAAHEGGAEENQEHREGEQSAVAAAAAVVQQAEGPLQVSETKKPRMMTTASNAAAVLAAAINTEMERIIMEDLAVTKAAIVTVEKQLARIRAGESLEEVTREDDVTTVLPASSLSNDSNRLEDATTQAQTDIMQIEGQLPAVHNELAKLREEKLTEEIKMVDLIKEIKGLATEGGEEEKKKLVATLKSMGGFVETLFSEEQGLQSDGHYASGSYSSPAIARRRRGRPPKGDISRTFYQSFLLAPASAPLPSSRAESPASAAEAKQKGRVASKPRKSRLSHAVHLTESDQAANGKQDSQPGLEGDNDQGGSEAVSPSQMPVEATTTQEGHDNVETTADAVNRAEVFILSQLASQQEENHSRDDSMPLDSTSFADFLPAQEELERQAEQEQTSGSQQRDLGHAFLEHGQQQQQQQSQEPSTFETPRYLPVPITPSVLSRLKQGPPGSCDICMRTETTVWRKLVLGGEDHKVCNACGLYHAKFGVIRPPELWGDGKSVKKRRSTARPSLVSGVNGDGCDGVEGGSGPRKRARKSAAGKRGLVTVSESDESRRAELDAALIGGLIDNPHTDQEQDVTVDLSVEQGGQEVDLEHEEGTIMQEAVESSEAAMASVFGVEV